MLSLFAANTQGEHASIDGTPIPVDRLAMTSRVVRMSVEDGPGGGGRKEEPYKCWGEGELDGS